MASIDNFLRYTLHLLHVSNRQARIYARALGDRAKGGKFSGAAY